MTQSELNPGSRAPGAHPPGDGMTPRERRAAISLAAIFALRMLGLFLVFPVISLHADEFADATPVLVGWAIGAYGLTQALFQIPFGMLSDRVGRKRVITAGLLLFAAGSAVSAQADTLTQVALGRAIQGVGAIAAAVMALAADLTREEQRTKAMAIIGVSIGLAFAAAQILGPALARWVGLSGLFWFTGALALAGIAVLHLGVPDPEVSEFHDDAEPVPALLGRVLSNVQLLRLDAGVLMLHMVMTATFVILPLALRDRAGLGEDRHWLFYTVVLAASVAVMVPAIVQAERHGRVRAVLVGAAMSVALGELGLAAGHGALLGLGLALVVYFSGFNVLEATLPSLVSRLAPGRLKGTALAAYSTSQYLGAFLGGPLGGFAYARFGFAPVFVGCGLLALGWSVLAIGVRVPPRAR